MTVYLLDTNILLRMSDATSQFHLLAGQATARLFQQRHQVCITSQNIIEFWVVATRPLAVNGLGLTVEEARIEVEQILNQFPLLEESPQIFNQWLNYVITNPVMGKRVHDTRLIAVMLTHGVTHILTFNTNDFRNTVGIIVVHPQTVLDPEDA